MDVILPTQGCVSCSAFVVLVQSLQEQVKALQSRNGELEARLGRNSSNSHMPPSSDPPAAAKPPPRKPTGNKTGGQPGHKGHFRKRLPPERVDHYQHYLPSYCKHCNTPLPQKPSPNDPPPRWHQVAELPPIRAIITEHQAHARTCPGCGKLTQAWIPSEVRQHVIGPNLAALMSYLAGRCHDGRRTVQEIVQDLFGVPVSLGTVAHYEQQMSQALSQPHQQALDRVRQAKVKYVDETGWKQAGEQRWLWTAAKADVAAYLIQQGRNWKGLCNLLGSETGGRGMVCSDRLHAYSRLGLDRRQLCWAHLKRDFQKWFDFGPATRLLGEDGLCLCKSVFALWRDFRHRRLSRGRKLSRGWLERRLLPLRRRMRQVLNWGLRCGVPKAVQFCRHLLRDSKALWTFANVPSLEPTNNHAERMLRCAVLWRKNSFGAHSQAGCRFVERMLTAIQTLRLQGRAVLDWLQQLMQAHRNGRAGPSLC